MRWLNVALYIAVTTGAVVLTIPIVIIAILIGAMGGGLYIAGALTILVLYFAGVFVGRRFFQGIFLRGINQKLADLKTSINFVPVLSATTSDKMAFLGFDTFSSTGVFLNYPQDVVQKFKFSDVLGCNWKGDNRTDFLEIILRDGKVKIGIPSDQFGEFKTRMFAALGMND